LRQCSSKIIRQEEGTEQKYMAQETSWRRSQVRQQEQGAATPEGDYRQSWIFTVRKQAELVTDWEPEEASSTEEMLEELKAVWTVLHEEKDRSKEAAGYFGRQTV
jgi:hypothetical protein